LSQQADVSTAAPTRRFPSAPEAVRSALRRRPAEGPAAATGQFERLGSALDLVSDWALLAFAAWTILAYLGMSADIRVSVLTPIWLAASLVLGLVLLRVATRSRPASLPVTESAERSGGLLAGRKQSLLLGGAFAAGVAFAILAGTKPDVPWAVTWLPAFVSIVLAFVALSPYSGSDAPADEAPGALGHVVAALTAVGFGIMSLFINRPSADDVFYVNRATATAGLDQIPVRDVLVTNEQVAPASGVGLPVDAFSALQGAAGRLLDVHAASVSYYVVPVVFTFLATWALWRLLRAWAPRRATACFAVGCVFLLLSAQDFLTPGSFFLSRMWQGKVIFVAWLVPTLYVYLTRWLGRRDTLTAALLVGGGIASIGLTGSAAFAAPLIFSTAVVPLLVHRDWRGLPVLVVAAAIPFTVGLVAASIYPLAEALGGAERGVPYYFHGIFGEGTVAAIGALALVAAPLLSRRGAGRSLTFGIAAVALLILAPGVLRLLQESGVTGALRRTLWVVPLPALVGLLASIRVARLPNPRVVAALPALVLLGLLVAFGNPLWDSHSGQSSFWDGSPSWKTPEEPLAKAREILQRYDGDGPILAAGPVMSAIALSTVDPKAVNPRTWYVSLTGESAGRKRMRIGLTTFVEGGPGGLTPAGAARALAALHVDLVCIDERRRGLIRRVREAGPYERAFRAREQVCLESGATLAG
jgi:hypothetical protein